MRCLPFGVIISLLAGSTVAAAQKPTGDTSHAKPPNAYRYRFLGVYDAATGEPIEGVEVMDALRGTNALTTETGTVSLMFLPDGGSLVRIAKAGYDTQTLTVPISPADTAPVTIILTPTAAPRTGSLRLRGRVVRSADGTPVAGADVMLVSAQQQVRSDSSGSFRFDALAAGPQLVQIRHPGFAARLDTVNVGAGVDSIYRFALMPPATKLDTVRTVAGAQKYTSPMLQDFEQRRLSGQGGRFISDSVLRRNENTQLTTLIVSRFPGLMLGAARLPVSSRKGCKGPVLLGAPNDPCKGGGAPNCFVSIYIDGILQWSARMAEAGVRPIDLNHMNISDFAGIEFYASNGLAPAGMNADDEGCGSVWMWTREK
jgi:Carboxypeptidase regulatory-like domain